MAGEKLDQCSAAIVNVTCYRPTAIFCRSSSSASVGCSGMNGDSSASAVSFLQST
jgi:hypothetical protein